MITVFRRLLRCTVANAVVEAALFAPVFLVITLGVTDIGAQALVRMTVNAAVQAGATYAVMNSSGTLVCASSPLTTTCVTGIKTAMNDATGRPSFCTGTVCSASSPTPCASGPSTSKCITVSVSYPFTPILPVTSGVYSHSWTNTQTVSATVTIRVL
jgi:hypothetical protein